MFLSNIYIVMLQKCIYVCHVQIMFSHILFYEKKWELQFFNLAKLNKCSWWTKTTVYRSKSRYEVIVLSTLMETDCKPRCSYRCSATSHKKPCMFFCQKCCAKCLCVPPGTYGNKQVCPCYNNWKTQQGGPKCPWNSLPSHRSKDS